MNDFGYIPVGKIAEKAVCRSAFLTTWHCIFSAEVTKSAPLQTVFWHFAHWDECARQNETK